MILSRAPSWFWASVDAKIIEKSRMFSASDDVFLIEIIDAKTHLSTKDPTGQVRGRFITLKGVLVWGLYEHDYGNRGNFTIINELSKTDKLAGLCHPNYSISPDAALWYLPVRHSIYMSQGEEWHGLILDSLEGDNNFGRVRYWNISTRENGENSFRYFGIDGHKGGTLGQWSSNAQMRI
jgi:hypothetical protein